MVVPIRSGFPRVRLSGGDIDDPDSPGRPSENQGHSSVSRRGLNSQSQDRRPLVAQRDSRAWKRDAGALGRGEERLRFEAWRRKPKPPLMLAGERVASPTGEVNLTWSGWAVEKIGQRALCRCNAFRRTCADVDHHPLVEQALSAFRASSAAGGNLQPIAETFHGVCPVVAGFVDLSIRNLVANTDIHGGLTFCWVSFKPRISLTRVIRNYFFLILFNPQRINRLQAAVRYSSTEHSPRSRVAFPTPVPAPRASASTK